jgi:HD-GYP domain-containing protein (c-di-GMP phosphodiesterase class II)
MPSTLTPRSRASSAHAPSAVKALAVVLQEEFNTPFSFYDALTGNRLVMADLADSAPTAWSLERTVLGELAKGEHPKITCLDDGDYLLGFPLDGFGPSRLLALGVLSAVGKSEPERALEQFRIGKWARAVQSRLRADRESRDRRHTQAEHERQAMMAWEAVMGLDKLHRSLRIHKEPVRHRRRILRAAGELLGAPSLAWVSLHGEGDVVQEGESLLSPWDCGRLASQLTEETRGDESSYVLVNDPPQTAWGTQYPQIANLLAVRVGLEGSSGWLLAFNKTCGAGRALGTRSVRTLESGGKDPLGKRPVEPFSRSDVMLLLPFASLVGLHVRATQSYLYIKDILIGLTRALTAAIDAKDAYTYGHSERVARAAVELGRELGLQEGEQNDIYLAGLLHDIGKIGVRDAILSKREPLTDEELAQIRQHPVIGHRILADLHAIAHLLPGVLYHHEQYDGSGYPEGLKQDAIPFLARILAVADSFDAMNTSRPYRAAMPPERVDQILRAGAGTQWDPRVIDAYFRCRDRLVAIRQRGLGASLGAALDGALRRKGKGESDLASIQHTIIR